MLDSETINALKGEIYEAFMDEIPITLPNSSRREISKSYIRISEKLAVSIVNAMKKAKVETELSPKAFSAFMELVMTKEKAIPVRSMSGLEIGSANILGRAIAALANAASSAKCRITGTLK